MAQDQRPKAIAAFEALSLASVLLFMLMTETSTPLLDLFDDAITVALTLWVSRGRSRIARVLYTFVIVVAYIAIWGALWLQVISPIAPLMISASSALELVLLALLWSPSVSVWLKSVPQRLAD